MVEANRKIARRIKRFRNWARQSEPNKHFGGLKVSDGERERGRERERKREREREREREIEIEREVL